MTTLFITHKINEALTIGDRVLVSQSPGKIIDQIDVPQNLDEDPEQHQKYRLRILDSLR
jgi:ABC-type nitrate/sulfonate/bicarbonate transport system ATPase subunit